ncbi:uncharacterized protein LOC110021971 [Phalaenopsis equestris]|uniref:uncharacterized protein LOC110021971 n=1 Tax=Phalaenopsis equestris TaxID=78828 RepID=UPI0009E64D70|nr:uncharacterized protein LOC110021971 [Phalaenopsis equestris]
MLSLSEVLLCHYRNDDDALEECDLKPMQQIIDNLEAVILLKKKGITGSSSRLARAEGSQPEVEVSNAEMSSHKVLTDAKENESAMSTGLDKHDDIVKSFSTCFKSSDEIAQEEDPKILLYKNLWVQTEATLCSLKHDIALMKLEMGSIKNHFKAKSLVSSDGLAEPVKEHYDLNCATSISAGSPSRSNSKFEKNRMQSISKDEEVDTSVFARYRILKGRDDVALSGLVEPQELNAIKSSVDREKGEMKELSPNQADKNAFEKKGVIKSHNASKFVVASPKNLKGEKLLALDHGVGSGLLLNNTDSPGVQESHLSATGGSVIQSYNPRSLGKRLLSSGSGSPSSEWEHVLKDEFTW